MDQFWLAGVKLDRDKERMNETSGLALRSSTVTLTGKRCDGKSNGDSDIFVGSTRETGPQAKPFRIDLHGTVQGGRNASNARKKMWN